jgi:hypothetical protein
VAAELAGGLRRRLDRLKASDPARRALLARVLRSEGELLVGATQSYERGCEALSSAGKQFANEADWRSAAQVWLKLADAQFSWGQCELAMATISLAVRICTEHCQDKDLKEQVDRLQEKIRQAMAPLILPV